ncbi:MAG: FAD-dependent oxidoreductase, partial [Chitinophagaceae bacterium]
MRIVVIGNGMVGYKFCEKLIAKSTSQIQITVFGEEIRSAYDRVHLSDYFSGKSAEDLLLAPISWYTENNITLHLGDPIQKIDRVQKKVISFHGIEVYYDRLIMATGSSAFVPSIPGIEKMGVFIYRTIEDLEMMTKWA